MRTSVSARVGSGETLDDGQTNQTNAHDSGHQQDGMSHDHLSACAGPVDTLGEHGADVIQISGQSSDGFLKNYLLS